MSSVSFKIIVLFGFWDAKAKITFPIFENRLFQQVYEKLQTILLVFIAPSFSCVFFLVFLFCSTINQLIHFWHFSNQIFDQQVLENYKKHHFLWLIKYYIKYKSFKNHSFINFQVAAFKASTFTNCLLFTGITGIRPSGLITESKTTMVGLHIYYNIVLG